MISRTRAKIHRLWIKCRELSWNLRAHRYSLQDIELTEKERKKTEKFRNKTEKKIKKYLTKILKLYPKVADEIIGESVRLEEEEQRSVAQAKKAFAAMDPKEKRKYEKQGGYTGEDIYED